MNSSKVGGFEKGIGIMSSILMYMGAGLLLIMLILGIADVMGRYFLNKPIIGTVEIFEILMPGVVLLSLPFTQRVKAHVTVDLFISKLPSRARAFIGFATTFWAIILFALIVWQGIMLVISYHEVGRVITNIGVPMFLPRILVPVGALAICLVFINDLQHFIREIKKNA